MGPIKKCTVQTSHDIVVRGPRVRGPSRPIRGPYGPPKSLRPPSRKSHRRLCHIKFPAGFQLTYLTFYIFPSIKSPSLLYLEWLANISYYVMVFSRISNGNQNMAGTTIVNFRSADCFLQESDDFSPASKFLINWCFESQKEKIVG